MQQTAVLPMLTFLVQRFNKGIESFTPDLVLIVTITQYLKDCGEIKEKKNHNVTHGINRTRVDGVIVYLKHISSVLLFGQNVKKD